MAKIVNETPNASIQVPTSKYLLKKAITKNMSVSVQYHIRCAVCKNYSVSLLSGAQIECESCSKRISTANDDFFIYLPIEEQLRAVVEENLDEILSYSSAANIDDDIKDIHDGIQYKKACEKFKGMVVLSMVVCTDGAQVFKSTNKSLWAIQLYLNFLKPSKRYLSKNIMVVGLHYAQKKPNMQTFFYPLLQDIQRMVKFGGFAVKRNASLHHFMPVITHCCCDLPAKSDVQGMTNHNGYNACGFCLHPGVPIKKDSKAKAVVRYIKLEKSDDSRTHAGVLNTYKKLKSNGIDGIKQISCLVALDDFDLINGFCVDYMHAVLLGNVKKIMNLWIDKCNHNERFYIKPKLQPILNRRIINIKPISEVARKPRSIDDRAKFKANEYRSLLLYYLPCCLNGLLNKCFIDHFQLLSSAIYMLLGERISKENVDIAESKLIQFADEFEKLYGKHNVTINLHLMRHIGVSVRHLGPLWAQSAFGMEDNNGSLVKVTARNKILQSIAFKYISRSSMRSLNDESDSKISVGGPKKCILSPNHLELLRDYDFEKQKPTIYDFMMLNGVKYTSKKSTKTATIDYYLKLKNGKFGAVEFYFVHELVIFGFMNEYKIIDRKNHINSVESTSQYVTFSCKEVEKKMIYMNVNNSEFLTSIPNRFERL